MCRDDVVPAFLYAMDQQVRWSGFSWVPLTIMGRRWTEHELLGPCVEYELRFAPPHSVLPGWVDELDLEPWREPEP